LDSFQNGNGGFEIPFHICRELSFLFAMIVMVGMSMAGPKINPKAFELDKSMFKLKPSTTALIIVTLLIFLLCVLRFGRDS